MYKKILVPFDDSEPARRALEAALDMARATEGQVTIFNVVEWRSYNAETFKIASRMSGVVGEGLNMEAIAAIDDETHEAEVGRIRESVKDLLREGDDVDIAVSNGSPHDSILAFAEDKGFDCIAMGHRGMGMLRGVLGSVCYSVLQKSAIPVLVVK